MGGKQIGAALLRCRAGDMRRNNVARHAF